MLATRSLAPISSGYIEHGLADLNVRSMIIVCVACNVQD